MKIRIMGKEEVQDKIKLKKHEISLEDDSNKLSELNQDLRILELRLQIEIFKERIKNLKNNSY